MRMSWGSGGSHGLGKPALEFYSEEEMGERLLGDALLEKHVLVLALGCPPKPSPLWSSSIRCVWMTLCPSAKGTSLVATGMLASPLGAQALRLGHLKLNHFSPIRNLLLLLYSPVNDATIVWESTQCQSHLQLPSLDPPYALSCQVSSVLLQDTIFHLFSLLFPSWFRPLRILSK